MPGILTEIVKVHQRYQEQTWSDFYDDLLRLPVVTSYDYATYCLLK